MRTVLACLLSLALAGPASAVELPAPDENSKKEAKKKQKEAEADAAEEQAPAPVTTPAPPPPKVEFALDAQERARFELMPDWTFDGNPDGTWRIANRARLGVKATFGVLSGYVQVQDVRMWGSEFNAANNGEGTLTDFNADGFDLHQAWGEVRAPYGLFLRIGRQEISWNGQRLIGAVGWAHQGRSFDALRIGLVGHPGEFDFFYALLLDRPVSATDLAARGADQHLIAVKGGPRVGEPFALDGVFVLRVDDGANERMATFGAHASGTVGPLSYEVEGYGQAGVRGPASVGAFLIGAQAYGMLVPDGKLKLGGGIDVVSGDADNTDGTAGSFDTLYATNHKFYGHMDRYLALPRHTANQGLIDGYFKVSTTPVKPWTLGVDLHFFGAQAPADEDNPFHGVEVDINTKVVPWKPLTISAGAWIYVPGSWSAVDGDPEFAAYVMTDFNFK